MPVIKEDKYLPLFINVVSSSIMISAILENISFHFKLFPVFGNMFASLRNDCQEKRVSINLILYFSEPPIQNMTSFEVYYMRSHGFWAKTVPFTPYHAVLLLITNKLSLYAWNFSDILATVLCRALRYQFDTLNENIGIKRMKFYAKVINFLNKLWFYFTEVLGPTYAIKRHADLIELMKILENYLSPLVFSCFYQDFYATCLQVIQSLSKALWPLMNCSWFALINSFLSVAYVDDSLRAQTLSPHHLFTLGVHPLVSESVLAKLSSLMFAWNFDQNSSPSTTDIEKDMFSKSYKRGEFSSTFPIHQCPNRVWFCTWKKIFNLTPKLIMIVFRYLELTTPLNDSWLFLDLDAFSLQSSFYSPWSTWLSVFKYFWCNRIL